MHALSFVHWLSLVHSGCGVSCGGCSSRWIIHCTKGEPTWRAGQEQTGAWLMTLQSALTPHAPIHGS
uniref:Putative secreted peptide n=1 Tax=Anopheles braziliensis TaxID=58242 RepID=A0A2M3ZNP5_9DIPT